MDKFSELKAAAEKAKELAGISNYKKGRDAIAAFQAAAIPAVVLALLEELKAKDKRISELEAIKAAAEKLVRCKGRYHSEQNYRALAALFGVTTPDLPPVDGDSEAVIAKLATPVRLPPPTAWMRGDDKTTFGPIFTKNKEYAESQWGDSAIALYSVPVGIKEAAFSDERNLMHINERGRETSLIWSKNNSENGDIQLFRLIGFTVEGDE